MKKRKQRFEEEQDMSVTESVEASVEVAPAPDYEVAAVQPLAIRGRIFTVGDPITPEDCLNAEQFEFFYRNGHVRLKG